MTNWEITTVSEQQCRIFILNDDTQFLNLMKHWKLVEPSDDSPHRKDAGALLVAVLSLSRRLRADALCGAYFLIFSLFDDHIDSNHWLLKSLDTLRQELFDLGISWKQLRFSWIFDALEQNVDVELVFESLAKDISHERNHLRMFTFYL